MSARQKMTMRAFIERDTATGTTTWNQPPVPTFTTHATLPCWAWSRADREIEDGAKVTALETVNLMVPKGSDVTEQDRVSQIEDRKGTVLFPGPLYIETVQRRNTHLELTTQAAS